MEGQDRPTMPASSHSILTPGRPVLALLSGAWRAAARSLPSLKSLAWPAAGRDGDRTRDLHTGSCCCKSVSVLTKKKTLMEVTEFNLSLRKNNWKSFVSPVSLLDISHTFSTEPVDILAFVHVCRKWIHLQCFLFVFLNDKNYNSPHTGMMCTLFALYDLKVPVTVLYKQH